MQDSKLVSMLRQLTSRERKRFVEFVQSPYFNKHERLMALADYLYTALSEEGSADDLDRHRVYAHVCPTEAYNEQKLADLQSYLVKLLERFLSIERYENNAFDPGLNLMTEFGEREMQKPFEGVARKLRKTQNEASYHNDRYYLNEYAYWDESDRHFMRRQRHTTDESLQQKVDALDLFFLTAKLRNTCEMINRQHVIAERYHFWLTEEVMKYLREHINDYEEQPAIMVYFHILEALLHPDDEDHFTKLKNTLQRYADCFPREETRYMYLYVQNYCIHKINQGRAEYLPELFGLYQWLLETGYILENGNLSQWDYKNIVSAAHRLEKYQWAAQFLEEWKAYLPESDRENAYNYNRAVLHYAQKEYGPALRVLQTVEFTDVYYALGARGLMLKIYYEMGEYEPLYALLESFKVYLKRNKHISNYQKTIHLNLIKLLRRLTNLRMRHLASRSAVGEKQLSKLREKIEETGQMANMTWFERKLSEFEEHVLGEQRPLPGQKQEELRSER